MDFWIAVGLIAVAVAVLVVRPAAQIARLEGHLQSLDSTNLEFHARLQRIENKLHDHGDRISTAEVYLPVPPKDVAALRRLAIRKGGIPEEFLAFAAMEKTLSKGDPPNAEDPFPEFPDVETE